MILVFSLSVTGAAWMGLTLMVVLVMQVAGDTPGHTDYICDLIPCTGSDDDGRASWRVFQGRVAYGHLLLNYMIIVMPATASMQKPS